MGQKYAWAVIPEAVVLSYSSAGSSWGSSGNTGMGKYYGSSSSNSTSSASPPQESSMMASPYGASSDMPSMPDMPMSSPTYDTSMPQADPYQSMDNMPYSPAPPLESSVMCPACNPTSPVRIINSIVY